MQRLGHGGRSVIVKPVIVMLGDLADGDREGARRGGAGVARDSAGLSVNAEQLAGMASALQAAFQQFARIDSEMLAGSVAEVGDRQLAQALQDCQRRWQAALRSLVAEGEQMRDGLIDTITSTTGADAAGARSFPAENTRW
jgi:hypothetical protein